jgi:predicted nucleic acid-binding protein
MAKPTVYLETTVISYATSRASRDLLVAARQQITQEWFACGAQAYQLFVSQIVVREASSGDEEAARARIALLEGLPLLAVTDAVGSLAEKLVGIGAIPTKATEDALHIAVAAVHGVDFLLTWNCKHIANAAMRQAIERICRDADYEPPVICTPEELTSDDED